MKCPFCHARDSRVIDSREVVGGESIRRRRECIVCARRFTTYERVELAGLVVVKKDGRRQEFDPAKLRQKLRDRGDLLLLSATYWTAGGNPNKDDGSFKQTQMGHACEWETSMMLRIHPHLVGDYQSAPDIDWGKAFAPAHRAWVTKDRTDAGHIGYPRHASAEKGETLFRVFAAGVVTLLERVIAWNGKDWDA